MLVSLAAALEIDVLSPIPQEYNFTSHTLGINVSEEFHSWHYSLNNKSDVTVCSLIDSETSQAAFNNGSVESSWNLNWDNEAQIRFDQSIVPQVPQQDVELCFLLYDNNWQQEDAFQFRVNDESIYTITDDGSLPSGSWVWKCVNLDSDDFSSAYNITMWYSNHSASGGMNLARSKAVPGSSSYLSTDLLNPPNASDENISWSGYTDDTDWMVNLTVTTAPQFCPLIDTTTIEAELGNNSLTVYANNTLNETANETVIFLIMGIKSINITPDPVQYGEQVIINANVVASNISSVEGVVTDPEGVPTNITMFDDGLHDDGLAGDNMYGVAYNTTTLGVYYVDITITAQNNSVLSSEEFSTFGSTFFVDITSPVSQEYNTTLLPLSVNITEQYYSWYYSLNNNSEVTACSFIDSEASQVSFNDGLLDGSWNLNGDNEAQIRFDQSIVPQVPHENVEICFLLHDNDWQQEDAFQFRVNDESVYTIADDTSLPSGSWAWKCIDINQDDFSTSYDITMWYSNHPATGGINLASSSAVLGSSSYFSTDLLNPPNASDENISWTEFTDDTDWMVNLTVTTAPQYCPLIDTTTIPAELGNNSLIVYANSTSGEITNDTQDFTTIGIRSIDITPDPVHYGEEITIHADVVAANLTSINVTITNPESSSVTLQMFDDGLHDDGLAEDNMYGVAYNTTTLGAYHVDVTITTQNNSVLLSKEFSTYGSTFFIDITNPISQEYNATLLPLSVNITEQYYSWYYSLNNNSEVTACSLIDSEDSQASFNDGLLESSWNLFWFNEAQIRFDQSIIPQVPQQDVEICFLLHDNDWQQEDAFQFRVNDDSVYTIADDTSLPSGSWVWKCVNLDSDDFSSAYNITMWYSNRSSSGGVSLANSKAVPGSSSYFSIDLMDPPDASDEDLFWIQYTDDTDWMVNLTVTTAPQYCPLIDTTTLQAELGNNTVIVYANSTSGEITNDTQTFTTMGVRSINITPDPVQSGAQVVIIADVVASNIASVTANVTNPQNSITTLTMFDDGLHNDGVAGDNMYGALFDTINPGIYNVNVTVQNQNFSVTSSETFEARNYVFEILAPKQNSTVNSTELNVTVRIPSDVASWGVSFDGAENITACNYTPPQDINVNYTDGTNFAVWDLKGNNDARIIFPKEDLPKGRHTSVAFCFYLFDPDPLQEETFQFRVNNGSRIYEIQDGSLNLPGWQYAWVCESIEPSDFSDSYAVTFWYSDRSTIGGLYIANDNSIPGVSSQWDNSSSNAPNAADADIFWKALSNESDWMVTAQIEAEDLPCPELDSFKTSLAPGFHNATVFMETPASDYFTDAVSFEVIDIQNITIYPESVKINEQVHITVEVFASNIQRVDLEIKSQIGDNLTLQMFDDGLHRDGGAQDGVYGASFVPTTANPHSAIIRAIAVDNTTVQKSKEFGVHSVRVGVVHSATTFTAGPPFQDPTELDYIEWFTSFQHELIMAGIQFDILGEQDLLDMDIIRQYDSLVFPYFKNVRAADRNEIINNLATLANEHGTGILASGDFMVYDENNNFISNSALNSILNVKLGVNSSDNVEVTIRVANTSHPSSRRYSQGEEIITFTDSYYIEYFAYDESKIYAYPYEIYDETLDRSVKNIIATDNGFNRVFFVGMPEYAAESALVRDGILWVLYGDDPHVGLKLTDKTVIWTTRVDADVSYDTAQTKAVIPLYRDVMERNDLVGGWYIVNKHSFAIPTAWEQLREDYLGMYNAGHEIGSHSYSHPENLNYMSDSDVLFEMSESKREIDEQLGISIEGFCNPGEPPEQQRLWQLAQDSGYLYYSPLEDKLTKGFGYIDDSIKIVNLGQNVRSDYELLLELNLTPAEITQAWIEQYDTYYNLGDGVVVFSIWHDYPFDEYPDMFGDFADYVAATDAESITPAELTKRFLVWNKQDFTINSTAHADPTKKVWSITRTTPDTSYAQVTLPSGRSVSQITGGTLKNTTDGKSHIITFEQDTATLLVDAILQLNDVGNYSVHENQQLTISLSALYTGDKNLTYSTSAHFGNLNATTGTFVWTPSLHQAGDRFVRFTVTDGDVSDSKTAKITVLDVNMTLHPNWVNTARIGGADIHNEMSDTELNLIFYERYSENVSVVELDSTLSDYLTEEQFDQQVTFLNHSAQLAHNLGLRSLIYYPSLEVITLNGTNIANTMFKDHPDWVQYGINGSPNVFYGSEEHWVDPDSESAWMSPNSPYRDYYLARVSKLAATDLDGIWVDVPLYLGTGSKWADTGSYAAADFKAWSIATGLSPTGYDVPEIVNFNDTEFKSWIRWRHENLANFIEDIRVTAHSINPDFLVVIENFPVDYMDATEAGLDMTYRKSTQNSVWISEVDSVSNTQAMKWSNNEDFDNKIAMYKWARGVDRDNPSWSFSYGNEELDAGLTMAAAVATGCSPFETKTPDMTRSVNSSFRSRWFGFIREHEQELFNTSRYANVGIWYSPASRDYQDFAVGGEYGMYVTTIPPTTDPYWWSNVSEDSMVDKPHLGGWRGAAHALTHLNIPYKTVADYGAMEKELENVSLIWLPSVAAISDASAQSLKDFVANGGTVLATGTAPGQLDEWGNTRSTNVLADLFGFTTNPPAERANKYGEGMAFYRLEETGSHLFSTEADVNMSKEALSSFEQIIRIHVPDTVRINGSSNVFVELSETSENKVNLYVVNYNGLQLPIVEDPQNLHIQYSPPEGYKVKSAFVTTPDIIGQKGALSVSKDSEHFYGFDVLVDQFALITLEFEIESATPPVKYYGREFSTPERQEAAVSGLNFILNSMRNNTAPEPYRYGVFTNLINDEGLTEIYAHGHHVTAEHMGLLLQVSACMNNDTVYNQSYRYVDEVMFAPDYTIVNWAIDRNTSRPLISYDDINWINSNAPLDDFRVINGLLVGGTRGDKEADLLAEQLLNGMYWTSVTDRHHQEIQFPEYPDGLISYAWDWYGTDNDLMVPPANATGIGNQFIDPIPIDYNDLYTMGLAAQKDAKWKGVLASSTDLLLASEVGSSGLFYNGYEANGSFTGDFENRDIEQGNHLKTIQVLWTALHLGMASEFNSSILDETRRTSSRQAAERSLGFYKSFYQAQGRVPEYLTYAGTDVPDCSGSVVTNCLTRGEANLFDGEARIYAQLARLALLLDDRDFASTIIESKILTDRINDTSDPRYGLIGASTAEANDAEAWNVLESVLTLCMEAKIKNASLLLNPISNVTVNEGENATIIPNAIYFGNNSLAYSINDTRFLQNGSAFTWVTNYDDQGIYSVLVSVTDGNATANQTVGINVINVNRPPVLALIPNITTSENSTVIINANATDPDNLNNASVDDNNLTFSINDSRFDQTNNTFVWQTNFSDAGIYDVLISVSDGSLTDNQSVIITINTTNRPPVLDPVGNKAVNENQTLTIQLTASDPENDILTYAIDASLPSLYTFNTSTGLFNWTPTIDDQGSYAVTFNVTDGKLTDFETITINVNNTNRPPVLQVIPNILARENDTIIITAIATDPDNNTLTYNINDSKFSQSNNIFTWQTGYDDAGVYDVLVSVTDGNLSDEQTVKISINNSNRAPILQSIGDRQVEENKTLTIFLNASDPDNDILLFNTNADEFITSLHTFDEINGVFNWTPTLGDAGIYTVTFNVTDSLLADEETITITVNATNRAPVLQVIPDIIAKENDTIIITAIATDPENDTLTYSINDSKFSQINNTFTWQTGYDDAGVYEVLISVTDGTLSDEQEVTITINNTNRAPVLQAIGDKYVAENQILTIFLNATDPDNDLLLFNTNAGDVITSLHTFDEISGVFNWTTTFNDSGTYIITFNVTDTQLSDAETITITVNSTNRAPILQPIGDKYVAENQTLTIYLSASDPDNDPIAYNTNADEVLPSPHTFDEINGIFNWTPTIDDQGSYAVTFNVTDGILTDFETITINVNNTNRPPVLQAIPDIVAKENDTIIITAIATDPDNNTLTYNINDSKFIQSNNIFTWQTGYDDAGTYDVLVSVTDGTLSDEQTVKITINNTNQAPILQTIGDRFVLENQTLTIYLIATDPDSDPITYNTNANEILPSPHTFDEINGVFNWTPAVDDEGTYIITFNVTDSLLADEETITITVNASNRPPVLQTIGDRSVFTNNALVIQLSASDPDNNSLTYGSNADTILPSSYYFDETTGLFNWTPALEENGTYMITFNVTDGYLVDSDTTSITVKPHITVEKFGESGSVDVEDFEWHYIPFSRMYGSIPVVIATPASQNSGTSDDNNAFIPAIRDITESGFYASLCRDIGTANCDTTTDLETLHWIAFDVDAVASLDWIAAG
ncbi:MAG: polysaccharide deacetylase family protein, partial [bacterium]|nr:polysaccharide deacetylase family protein [bacterium]